MNTLAIIQRAYKALSERERQAFVLWLTQGATEEGIASEAEPLDTSDDKSEQEREVEKARKIAEKEAYQRHRERSTRGKPIVLEPTKDQRPGGLPERRDRREATT